MNLLYDYRCFEVWKEVIREAGDLEMAQPPPSKPTLTILPSCTCK